MLPKLRRILLGISALVLAGNIGVPMLLDPKPIPPTDISSTQTQFPDKLTADLDLTGLLPDLRAQIAKAMKAMLESSIKASSEAASDLKSVANDSFASAIAPAKKSALAPYLWPGADNALKAAPLAATSDNAATLPLGMPTANMLNPDGLPTSINPPGISSYLQKLVTTPSCSLPTSCSARVLP